jgi:hypothetical protein
MSAEALLSVVTGLRTGLFLAFAMIFALAAPASAQVVESVRGFSPSTLRPGQYVWFDEAQPVSAALGAGLDDGAISMIVSIPQQLIFVYRGGTLVGVSTVSTGKPGKATPTGSFTILQKNRHHRSNLYSNAPMPWMQRLTWDGIALHGGHLPGYPASHGCIRLPAGFARQLFAMTRLGGQVSVVNEEIGDPRFDSFGAPVLMADTRGLGGEAFNVVTVSAIAPRRPLRPVKDDGTRRPVSWVTGPAVEVVQPLPPRAH